MDGIPEGMHDFNVSLYSSSDGNNRVWHGKYSALVSNGLFSLDLGSGNYPFADARMFDQPLWMGISVDNSPELRPLTRLSNAPTAMNVIDGAITTSKLKDGAITANKISADYVGKVTINGTSLAGPNKELNLVGGKGIELDYDAASESIIIKDKKATNNTGKGDGALDDVDDWTNTGDDWAAPAQWLGTTGDNAGDLEFRIDDDGPANTGRHRVMLYQVTGTSPNLLGGYYQNAITAGRHGSTIGGGGASANINQIDGYFGTVAGGAKNSITNEVQYATVSGGYNNTASSDYTTISGGEANTSTQFFSTVGGGFGNDATDSYAVISGGQSNTAGGIHATVGGGLNNVASGTASTVSGGYDNVIASATSATIGGGEMNQATGTASTIAGGSENLTNGAFGAVGGGRSNIAASYAAIAGGWNNEALYGATASGVDNLATGQYSTVGGGFSNEATHNYSTVGGGYDNTTTDINATVGGGEDNNAGGPHSTVGGGRLNVALVTESTVGGGLENQASGLQSTVGGGISNLASGVQSTVAGGDDNEATMLESTVGGGARNHATNGAATIGGGNDNFATGGTSTIGGGYGSFASGHYSFIGGGYVNNVQSTAEKGVISGGMDNIAKEDFTSIVGGFNLRAESYGQVVGGFFNTPKGTQTTLPVVAHTDTYNEPLLILGNGSADNARQNAFEVSYNGHSIVYDRNGPGTGRAAIRGATYMDNVVYAWGNVNVPPVAPPVGTLLVNGNFGVTSVTYLGVGSYRVQMNLTNPDGTAMTIGNGAVTATVKNSTCTFISTSDITGNGFTITITELNLVAGHCQPKNASFMFHVTGRPQ